MKDFVLDKALFSESGEDVISCFMGFQILTDGEQVETLSKLVLFQVQATSWLEVDFTDWRKKADQKELNTIKQEDLAKKSLVIFLLEWAWEREQRKIYAEVIFKKAKLVRLLAFVSLRLAPRFLNSAEWEIADVRGKI